MIDREGARERGKEGGRGAERVVEGLTDDGWTSLAD